MKGYHVTTPKKLKRYRATGYILEPVRFWPSMETATAWARKTGRTLICEFDRPDNSYPLPDHRPAMWTHSNVHDYTVTRAKP